MDFRGSRVLVASIFCSLMVIVILIFTFKLTRPVCELISEERLPVVRVDTLKLIKSRDSTVLVRISGYFEYNLFEFQKHHQQQVEQQQSLLIDQQQQSLQAQMPLNNQTQQTFSQQPTPSIARQQPLQQQSSLIVQSQVPQYNQQPNFQAQLPPAQQQLPQITPSTPILSTPISINTNATFKASPVSSPSNQFLPPKRFQPFEFKDLIVTIIKENASMYKFTSDCGLLVMMFEREPKRVYVKKAYIELKIPNKGKNICDLNIDSSSSFGVSLEPNGLGHYACNKQQIFACDNLSNNNMKKNIGFFVLTNLEYEVGRNATNIGERKNDFTSVKKEDPLCKAAEENGSQVASDV